MFILRIISVDVEFWQEFDEGVGVVSFNKVVACLRLVCSSYAARRILFAPVRCAIVSRKV